MASVQKITPSLFKTTIVGIDHCVKKLLRRKKLSIRIRFHIYWVLQNQILLEFMDFTNSQAELITALQSIRSVEATAPRQEWGQSNASWVSFLTGFTSEKVYRKNVNDFLLFHENEQPSSNDLGMSLIIYFQKLYDSGNYKATSLRSFYSVFKKIWLHSGRGDLKAMLPIIESNIDKWTKEGSCSLLRSTGYP